MTGCVYNAQGCLVCPALPAEPGAPGYLKYAPLVGWNAGANSIQQLSGDVHTSFGMAQTVVGTLVGFKTTRDKQTIPLLLNYGLYFFQSGAVPAVQVYERGVPVAESLAARAESDVFEIRRAGGTVTYWQNATLLHTSSTRSYDALVVNACMYMSGDTVGGT